jgi:putative acetyltransferase
MQINIRPETTQDHQKIRDINELAFGQENEAILIEKLRLNPRFPDAISLVAEVNDEVVGHILFFPVQIVNNEKIFESLALAPMAVLPPFQNKSIGTELVYAGLETARCKGYQSVIVLGHKDYYPRFGFQLAKRWDIRAPFEVPTENFMALELEEKGLSGVSGTVRYPVEFDEVG